MTMKKWMILSVLLLTVAGCTKHTVRERGNVDIPDSHTVETQLQLRSDWTIAYKGRETFTEDNGRQSRVEHVNVVCPGAGYYIIRTVLEDDFKDPDIYNSDRKAFFEAEAKYLQEDAKTYGEKVTDYMYVEEMQDYLFDRMRMGSYRMFLIGLDATGNITGSYAETTFTLAEETPSEDYLKWIGEWTVGDGTVSYPVSVEQGEANFTYIFRGWETGESISPTEGTVMDQEYLETSYDFDSGSMYFTSQYLGTYEDNGRNLDELFLGKVNVTTAKKASNNGIWLLSDEGLDLGVAEMSAEGTSVATISGCGVYAWLGDEEVLTDFISMQYVAGYMDGNEVAYDEYNLNVPGFPLTMSRTRSSVARPAWQPRPATRASIHRAQPRLHSGEQRALHATRVQ